MNADLLFDPTFSLRLCLALLHSLWQMLLIAILVWGTGRLIRNRSVERRYLLHVAGLVTGLALLPVTFLLIDVPAVESPHEVVQLEPAPESGTVETVLAAPVPMPDDAISGEYSVPPAPLVPVALEADAPPTAIDAAEPTADTPHPIARWIVAAYAAGVLVMLVRLAIGLWSAHRLAAKAALLAEGPTLDLLRSLTRQWSMRITPALAIAEHVIVPKVVGLLRPTILLPASAVTGLSTDELRMILAHELAHIRRHDLWINLLQRLAETLLFFNPALWYLSRRISTLREYCCDELTCRGVLSGVDEGSTQSGGLRPPLAVDARASYAAALVRVAELSQSNAPESPARQRARPSELTTLAASGRSPSDLRRRIAHLFGEPIREPLRLSRGGLTGLITVAALLAFGLPLIPNRAQTADAAADQDDEETVDRLSKKFSFGGKIEVVAIGTHNEVPQRWWDAAGKPLESVPFSWQQDGMVGADGTPRRIVYRIDQLPNDAEVTWKIVGRHGSAGGKVLFKEEPESARYFTRYFLVPEDRKTVKLRVGVARGVWKTVSEMRVDGSQALGLADNKTLVYSGSFDTPRGVVAIVSHNFFDTNFRIVAVDKQGAIHDSTGRGGVSAGGIYQTKSTFPNLMSNEIDHFEFQTRDYEWVEIDELPLNPNPAGPAPQADGAVNDSGRQTSSTKGKVSPWEGNAQETEGSPFNIIIARHVMLLDGREIITWEQLEEKIADLPDPSRARPRFFVTRGARDDGKFPIVQTRFEKLRQNCDVIQDSRSLTRAPDWVDERFDIVRNVNDLVPDKRRRLLGIVIDSQGEEVSGAEVVLVTSQTDQWNIHVSEGRVVDRFLYLMDESDDDGAFAVHPPPTHKFVLVTVHPERGFDVTADSHFTRNRTVRLSPWAKLECSFPAEVQNQTSRLRRECVGQNGWPSVQLLFEASRRELADSRLTFQFEHVPPGDETTISRYFPDNGNTFSIPAASVGFFPGESRRIDFGPVSKKHWEILERETTIQNKIVPARFSGTE